MKLRISMAVTLFMLVLSIASGYAQTLTVMHWNQAMVKGTAWWDEITSGFEAAHPGVTIESNFVTFNQYLPTLTSMSAGDQLPDVFFGHVMAAQLGRAGLAINYKDVFDDAYFERFFPGPIRQFTFDDGAVYALPWSAQIFGIFVNDKIMSDLGLEVPETWDQLIEMAPTMKAAGYIPLVWGNKAGNVCPDFFLPLVTQYGGDVYALDDLTAEDVSWNSEPVTNALALLDQLTKAGVFVDGINGIDEDQGKQIFYQEQAAMLYSGSWMPPTIDELASEEVAQNYSVHKVPALTADDIHWTGDGSGEGWVVSANSPNKDLALEFVEYVLSDEVYAIHTEGSQDFPSLPSVVDKVTHPKVGEMMDWMNTDGTDHILFGQGSWDAVSNVCQSILDGSTTPEEGAAKIQADVEATRGRN